METIEQARSTIHMEVVSDDSGIRKKYLTQFEAEVSTFADVMSYALVRWRDLEADGQGDEKKAYVAALAYAAISLHINSFKFFLSGHIVAAGNLSRQVLEAIALALLCSSQELDVLPRFMENRYSTNNAIRDVLRSGRKLGLEEDGLQALSSAQEFYHKYSHISHLTLASLISFSDGNIYIGGSFDNHKMEEYRKEIYGRISLAKVLVNFIQGIRANIAKW